ncbi:MAG: hypothetical protein HC836_13915 [Richelia sp. RM2_1_2]|nr:hypothetical protein [Richelia sp. RM2_1_2]
MSAAAYDYDNSSSKHLLPKDPLGQHFVKYFQHGWKFIQAPVPKYGEKPSWRTETRYPLELRSLWSKYQKPDLLLGLRLGSFTNYCLLDIDKGSKYHPDNSKEKFNQILLTLEGIGLNRDITIRSSESEGLHIYFFLPECVHSSSLAFAVKHALIRDGFQLIKGELEVFPNPKPFNKLQPTSFNAHRLPLQANSFILDWDLQPTSDDIKVFLDCADLTAQSQDMEVLKEAMEAASEWRKGEYSVLNGKKPAAEFCADLEEQIEPGWTGFHQTNILLLTVAKYGIIFLHHLGQNLIDYMQETVPSLPGYKEYCRHQHEISKRIRDIAASAERYPYIPCPNSPLRQNTYQDHFFRVKEEKNKIVHLHPSKKRQAKRIKEIKAVVAALKNQGIYPETCQKRSEAIIDKSKEMFGRGGSQTTLHKPQYLPLWHPDYDNIPTEEQTEEPVNADSTKGKGPVSPPAPDTVAEDPEALQEPDSSHLHFEPLYEGLCAPAPGGLGGLGGSASGDELQLAAASVSGAAAKEHEVTTTFDDGQQLQAASPSEGSRVIFLYLKETEIIPNLEIQDLEIIFIYLEICGIFSTAGIINSKYFNFLTEIIQSEHHFEQFNDKENLSVLSGGSAQNSDKPNLSISQAVNSSGVEGDDNTSQPTSEAPTEVDNSSDEEIHPDNYFTPSNPSQTPQEQSSNSPPSADTSKPSTTAEHFSENNNSDGAFTPHNHIDALRFEFKAQEKAKKHYEEFFALRNIRLMPRQRKDYEYLIKNYLMFKSSHAFARQKATEWFTNHQELVNNARELGLWDYLEQLPLPDF